MNVLTKIKAILPEGQYNGGLAVTSKTTIETLDDDNNGIPGVLL